MNIIISALLACNRHISLVSTTIITKTQLKMEAEKHEEFIGLNPDWEQQAAAATRTRRRSSAYVCSHHQQAPLPPAAAAAAAGEGNVAADVAAAAAEGVDAEVAAAVQALVDGVVKDVECEDDDEEDDDDVDVEEEISSCSSCKENFELDRDFPETMSKGK